MKHEDNVHMLPPQQLSPCFCTNILGYLPLYSKNYLCSEGQFFTSVHYITSNSRLPVWGGLTIAVKRREEKSKREKERYTHLNVEFQKIARRDKKAFLSDQCKETEENNRMGKTRDLFKKIRDIKGIFHAKMGLIKDRNGMDLTEAEILRRGGKNTQNYTKRIFMTQIIIVVWSLI